jgi:hypothetical protein
MMKKWLLVWLLVMGLFLAQAEAGVLYKAAGSAGYEVFSAYPQTAKAYKVAYEIYNPGLTTTDSSKGVIGLRFATTEISGGVVQPGTNGAIEVAFRFPNGDARFHVVGLGYIWLLVDNPTTVNNIYAASTLAAEGPIINLSSANVDCSSNQATNCNIPGSNVDAPNVFLVQAQWNDTDQDNLVDVNEIASVRYVSVNLVSGEANCAQPYSWKLTASISGSGNIYFPDYTFAYVTPQFGQPSYRPTDLTAELNVDFDMNSFYPGSGPNVISDTEIEGPFEIEIPDNLGVDPHNWIAYTTSASFNVTFNLASDFEEPGVSTITINNIQCTTNNQRTWDCALNNLPAGLNSYTLDLEVDHQNTNAPTNWNVSNFTVDYDPNVLKGVCFNRNLASLRAGVWSGGVEAIVPFVKYSPNEGAQTYIVLYNRRDHDARVFAAAMLNNSDRLIQPQTEVGVIPAHGRLLLTASDLKSKLPELADWDMANGVPIKFRIYVPSALWLFPGTIGVPPQYGGDRDPYVEGIVVSVYGGSTQRSVPLKFRSLRHGFYNE